MNKELTEIVIVLDRSGSMSGIKNDMEGGLKAFLDKQKNEPGECRVTLYQFDDQFEKVFENKDVKDINDIVVTPRGMTALLDAIGKSMNQVGERLAKTPESNRPGLVLVVIITDGFENASKEFNKSQIKEMIKHQQDIYNWSFVFLGANQDAIQTGSDYGISKGTSITFGTDSQSIGNVYNVLISGASCLRAAALNENYNLVKNYMFSDEERTKANLKE